MLRCLVLFALLWVARASTEPKDVLRVVESANEKATPSDSTSDSSHVDRERFFFFGAYNTLSQTLVSFTTSTVHVSCFQGFSTTTSGVITPCGGKRRKRWTSEIKRSQISRTSEDDELSSSQDEKLNKTQLEEDANLGDAKKLFTVWTNVVMTTTLTSYFTNSDTTISLTYYCSAGSIEVPFIKC